MNQKLSSLLEKNRQISRERSGSRKERARTLTANLACYFVLIGIGFVYLYPIIYMLVLSVMPTTDLINPTIKWIPTALDLGRFKTVFEVLDYSKSFFTTFLLASFSSVVQTITCALAGYALARYPVPGKKFWVFLILLTFIIPTDAVMVPRYVLYNEYHLLETLWSMMLPAMFGQGIKASLFVFLFMQNFSSYPKSYDEAAQLDGAGNFRLFFKVALPLAIPIIVLSLLFSFIWYWNETSQSELFFNGVYRTLPLQLKSFDSLFSAQFPATGTENRLNESFQMVSTLLVISPLVLLYFGFQKSMISSIESAGITGE